MCNLESPLGALFYACHALVVFEFASWVVLLGRLFSRIFVSLQNRNNSKQGV